MVPALTPHCACLTSGPALATGRNKNKTTTAPVGEHLLCCACAQLCPTLRPRGLQPARLLCAWDSLGRNTGAGCHSLLQGVFLTQGSNLHLLHLPHCRLILYPWSHLLWYVTLIPSTEQTGNEGLMIPTSEMRQLRGRWFSQGHRAAKC